MSSGPTPTTGPTKHCGRLFWWHGSKIGHLHKRASWIFWSFGISQFSIWVTKGFTNKQSFGCDGDCVAKSRCRKNWLWHHFEFSQLTGIGGPGAPHVMRLERIGNSGVCHAPWLFSVFCSQKNIKVENHHIDSCSISCLWLYLAISWCGSTLSGVSRDSVDTRFWDRQSYTPSPSDVILRTGCRVDCNPFDLFSNTTIINAF